VKQEPLPGHDPDCRPSKGRDMDVATWTKGIQRGHTKAVCRQVTPQQLAVGVPDGVAIKVHGSNLKLEEARKLGVPYVQVAMDVKNAHNAYDRRAAQQILEGLESEHPDEPAFRDLSRAHHSDCAHSSDVYVRDHQGHRGLKWLCEGRAGGPQGSALTCVTFPVLLDVVLKGVEAKFPDVEAKAIQDDIDLYGDPADILGDDGALQFILLELKRVAELDANPKKFQAYTPTPAAFSAALSPEQGWLKRPFIITDGVIKAQVEAAESLARSVAAGVEDVPRGERAAAKAAAEELAKAAAAMRAGVPEEHRAYGITGCGAAVGDDAFVEDFLLKKQVELCGDPETGAPGSIASVTASLSVRSAHCAHTAIFYSLQSRVDYLLAVHLPSQTRQLAAAVDASLRKAYAQALGADMLDPEGDFPGQRDPAFMAERFSLKASQGGAGYRITAERAPFLNSVLAALPRMSGTPTELPLWASLSGIIGDRSVYDKANTPESSCWTTFFASGSRWAQEMRDEIARVRGLREQALKSAGLAEDPPKSPIFDVPDEGFGARTGKVQKKIFDEIKKFRATGLAARATELLPADQRRMAFEKGAMDQYSNSLVVGTPLRSTQFSNEEWQAAAQARNGACLSCLSAYTNNTLKSNASAADKSVDPFGNNIKKLVGAEGGGTTINHDSFVNVISRWLKRAGVPHRGGAAGNGTCKNLFTHITQNLNDVGASESAYKVLQTIIPDLLVDARSVDATVEDASKALLAGEVSVVDVKTKAPNEDYHKKKSPVGAKQDEIAAAYEWRAKRVDDLLRDLLGIPEGADGPMVQALKQYRGGRVLVPVVGAFAEMSSDTELIADLIATALAADHIQFYSESAKQAKGMFKQRIRKAWGHTAHRGWARLLLDRRRDLIIHGPASHRTCPDTAGGLAEDELEHHNYHCPDRGGTTA